MLDEIQSHLRAGRYPEAISQVDRICAANPERPDIWLLKASIHAQAGDLPSVVTACGRALALQANNVPARYNLALALQMLGRRQAAIENYRLILASDPLHIPSLANLGMLYREEGQLDESLEVLDKVLAHQPRFATARNSLGLVYSDLGKYDEAVMQFRAALDIQPELLTASTNIARTLWKRGNTSGALTHLNELLCQHPDFTDAQLVKCQILRSIGRQSEAIDQLSRAIALAPQDARLHYEIAHALARDGRLEDAIRHYKAAIDLNPGDYQSLNNLGALLHSAGRTKAGIDMLNAALAINPDSIQIHVNLCIMHAASGNDLHAQEHILHALRLRPGNRDILQRFAQTVGNARKFVPGLEFENALLECFRDPGIDQQNLAPCALTLIMSAPDVIDLCSRCRQTDTPRYPEFDILWNDHPELLEQLLTQTIIPNKEFEFCLRAYRRAALWHFIDADGQVSNTPSDTDMSRLLALAHQCFNNEFVYATTPTEERYVSALTGNIYNHDATDTPHAWVRLVFLALYTILLDTRSESEIPRGIFNKAAELHQSLLKKHVHDAAREADIRRELPQMTPISEGTSASVRDQYEESPYPRWLSLDIQNPRNYETFMRDSFPHFRPPDFASKRIDVLIAGCGTGKHAILSATRFADCAVTALDLSRSSLAYGKRRAEELGISNIDFYCGDILRLSDIDKTFHIIESVGVLHHLADPERGLSVLRGLLKPRGLVNLGFYSTIAREAVDLARNHYGPDACTSGLAGIRRARNEILMLPPNHPIQQVTGMLDFYSLSDCRDLLFHTQETCYTLPEIAGLLERNRLDFVGFELPDSSTRPHYLCEFPDDTCMTDLAKWDHYERRHPDTFVGMYVFWCQARD